MGDSAGGEGDGRPVLGHLGVLYNAALFLGEDGGGVVGLATSGSRGSFRRPNGSEGVGVMSLDRVLVRNERTPELSLPRGRFIIVEGVRFSRVVGVNVGDERRFRGSLWKRVTGSPLKIASSTSFSDSLR